MQDDVHKTQIQRVIVPQAQRPKAGAVLVVIAGEELGRKHPINLGEMSIGRTSNNLLCVDDAAVSRNHATLICDDSGVRLRDNGSTNGSFVNGELVTEVMLKEGDLIKIGPAIFKFLAEDNVEASFHDEIYRLSTLDGLTQIYNKRYFHDALDREVAAARRYRRPLSLLMFDIDHFKRCNDEYGHLAGDYVLRRLAGLVHERSRGGDVLARSGGEEFSVILPGVAVDGAGAYAESLRSLIARSEFVFEGRTIPVTISIGVAALDETEPTPQDLIKKTDDRLYAAKRSGRNCVVTSDS